MKALILAAGLGTRLKPLTDRIPKALVKIGDKTLLDLTIERLKSAGATKIVVNIHHHGEQIIRHIAERYAPGEILISDERNELLDTGGGLRQAASLFTATCEPILIHNVDILHNADLKAFYAFGSKLPVTLMVSQRETSRYLLFDETNKLMGWTNVKTGEIRTPYKNLDINKTKAYAFSGIHCFSPSLIPFMKEFPHSFPIMDFYLSKCAEIAVYAYPVEQLHLLDVGKTDSLATAEQFLQEQV